MATQGMHPNSQTVLGTNVMRLVADNLNSNTKKKSLLNMGLVSKRMHANQGVVSGISKFKEDVDHELWMHDVYVYPPRDTLQSPVAALFIRSPSLFLTSPFMDTPQTQRAYVVMPGPILKVGHDTSLDDPVIVQMMHASVPATYCDVMRVREFFNLIRDKLFKISKSKTNASLLCKNCKNNSCMGCKFRWVKMVERDFLSFGKQYSSKQDVYRMSTSYLKIPNPRRRSTYAELERHKLLMT